MKPAEIKLLRTQTLLKELIPEALSQMGNSKLHELSVTEVICSRGRSDAKVFIDPTGVELKDEASYLAMLSKARHSIEEYCKNDQGWFRCAYLTFEFDHQLEHNSKMEDLFSKIEKELHPK